MATYPAMQRLSGTANLGCNGFDSRPFGGIVVQVLHNHAHGTLTDFGGVAVGFSDSLILSRVEASTKTGAIQYARVSSADQNSERQLDGVELAKLFTDKASGKDSQRPQLKALLEFVREGDTVVVHSLDRLARNLDDLRSLVQTLTKKGVAVEFLKERLTFTGDDSPMANLMLSVMGAFAEFERALIRERQSEGIALAKKRGAYKGRKKSLSPEEAADLRARVAAGAQKSQLAAELGVSRQTIYKYLVDL